MLGKKNQCMAKNTWVQKDQLFVDKNLTIKYIWRKVKVEGHVNEVFDKYQELTRDH